ncbi:MAG: glycosyltransferase family 2 protein [Saprospiraceae bacterium]
MTENLLFPFLKYVNPVWYFNLQTTLISSFFYDIEKMTRDEQKIVDLDHNFSTATIAKRDAAYQMWHKGFIKSVAFALPIEVYQAKPTRADNYRFIRRHFHSIWSWYILLVRLVGLNNPFKEISAFIAQSGTKRIKPYISVFSHKESYNQFESNVSLSAPKVSVIIPTLNRYPFLADALKDLEKQDYPNFEVIVIDQSSPFQEDFYKKFDLSITVRKQHEKALWLARNTAIRLSNADYLLFFDDDSRVEKDWISQHLKCIDFFKTDISAGVSISKIGDKVPENYRHFRWADQLDTGNALIKRKVFEKIGLFDRQFEGQRMGDGEFGLRAHLADFSSISNCHAQRLHLKVSEGGLREMGSWDGFRPKSWFAPRPVPSVLYFFRRYFSPKTVMLGMIIGVLPSIVPYRFKKNRWLLMTGSLLSVLLLPLIFIQVLRSWIISTDKMKEGPKIEFLK